MHAIAHALRNAGDPMSEATQLTERLIFLRAIPLLQELSAGELLSLARTLRAHSFERGQVILREAEAPTAIHLIVSGRVGISRKGHAFGTVEAPNGVGFLPLVARLKDAFEVTADLPTRTLEANSDSVRDLLEEHFEILISAQRNTSRMLLRELQRRPRSVGERMDMPEAILPDHALDVVERIFFLRRMLPFRGSSIDALAAVSRSMKEVRFGPGQTIWRNGEASGSMLLIVGGSLRAVNAGNAPPVTFGPGAAIGGFESMALAPRWYDLVTDTSVIALSGSSEGLLEVFEDNHDMARDFLAMSTSSLMALWDERTLAGDPPVDLLDALFSIQSGPRIGI